MKRAGIAVAVLAVLVVALVVVWMTSIDHLVARAIESYGSEILGTAVSVGSVELDTAAGRGTIAGLSIAQPDGFGGGDAIRVDEITLDLDTTSLLSGQPYVVELVRVAKPEVNFILKADRSNNLSVLQEHAAGEEAAAAAAPEDETETLIRIDRLEIEQGKIDADLSAVSLGKNSLSLPPVRQNGVGGPAGSPPAEIGGQIANRFLTHTVTTITASKIGRSLEKLLGTGAAGLNRMLDSLVPR